MNLLPPGDTRYPKVDIPRLNCLMILLTLFAINVGGGTRVVAGTPWIITIPGRKRASSNILPDMLRTLMMRIPLVDEVCI